MNAHTPPARKDHIDALGASLLIGFSALMGCNQVIMKLVNQGMNPVFQAGLRSVAAAVPVLLFVWWRGAKVPLRGGVLIPGIVTGLFFALEFLLIFKALDFTSVTRRFLICSAPRNSSRPTTTTTRSEEHTSELQSLQ